MEATLMLLVAGDTSGWGRRVDVEMGEGVLSGCDDWRLEPGWPNTPPPGHDAADVSGARRQSATLGKYGTVEVRGQQEGFPHVC
jgi:hypothetical protein